MTKVHNLYKNPHVELLLLLIFTAQQVERTFPGDYIYIHMCVVIKLTFKCINVNEVDIQENILHNKCKRQPFTKFQSLCLCKFVQIIQAI